MAPVMRPSQPNISKAAVPASRPFIGVPNRTDDSRDRQDGTMSFARSFGPRDSLDLITGTVREDLRPVIGMAERVGKEVEDFAEMLDKWNEQRQKRENRAVALGLLDDCRDVANKAVANLKKRYGTERSRREQEIWSVRARNLQNDQPDTKEDLEEIDRKFPRTAKVKDLEYWQEEADTWELLQIVLKGDAFRYYLRGDRRKLTHDPENSLSDPQNPWQDFLAQNPLAKERHLITKWLESTAEHTGNDLSILAERLEERAGRNAGTWSHGFLDTRERIKGAKRLRPFNASNKDADTSIVSDPMTGERIVSALDPDAKFREGLPLEGSDEFFERSLWLTCWEMLRRGRPLSQVREWCAERHENWRSISIGAATATEQQSLSPREIFAHALWRRMCIKASNNTKASDYERAVYGLLGGNSFPTQVVCRNWDDLLYADLKELLAGEFDYFLRKHYSTNFPEAVHHLAVEESMRFSDAADPITAHLAVTRQVFHGKPFGKDVQTPMKAIQDGFISHQPMALVSRFSAALSKWKIADSQLYESISSSQEHSMRVFALDPQALRVMVHVVLILQDLDPDHLFDSVDNIQAADNVLATYIELLKEARKLELIPLYASRLQYVRPENIIARILPTIGATRDRVNFIKLLQTYRIDVLGVLTAQYEMLLSQGKMAVNERSKLVLDILEPAEPTHWPGQRIKSAFYRNELEDAESAIIHSLEWFLLVDGYWVETFKILTKAMKIFLRQGRIAAAVALCEKLPTRTISELKTASMFGTSVDVWAEESPEELAELFSSNHSSTSKLRYFSPVTQRKLFTALRSQSKSYRDLEALANALRALQDWRGFEDTILELNKSTTGPQKSDEEEFKVGYDEVFACIQPLLKDGWLVDAANTDEAEEHRMVRNTYIPSMILGYNSMLGFAAQLFGRDVFLHSLELANTIGLNVHDIKATTRGSSLAAAFVETGSMESLVTSMAWISSMILHANDNAWTLRRKKAKKRGPNGETLSIWDPNATMCAADES
ncbi:MAG: Nucleoporin nup84 [Bathelium mastoideum]|nr:MAG: Nucleoporin nup84 [Bathelium mastoideum]